MVIYFLRVKNIKKGVCMQIKEKISIDQIRGKTVNQVAQEFNIRYYRARYIFQALGVIPVSEKIFRIPSFEELKNLNRYDIVQKYGVCTNTADKWLAYRGIKTENISEIKRNNIILQKKLKAITRWSQYAPAFVVLNDVQLAKAFDCSKERVRQIRQHYGWPCLNKYSQKNILSSNHEELYDSI